MPVVAPSGSLVGPLPATAGRWGLFQRPETVGLLLRMREHGWCRVRCGDDRWRQLRVAGTIRRHVLIRDGHLHASFLPFA